MHVNNTSAYTKLSFPKIEKNVAEKKSAIEKQTPLQEPSKTQSPTIDTILSSEEKNFFADMYPSLQSDSKQFVSYQKNGLQTVPTVGTLIDRKG